MSTSRGSHAPAFAHIWLWPQLGQRILYALGCAALMIFMLGLNSAAALEQHPLEPPDTSSPRATVKSFIDTMDKAYLKQLELGPRDVAAIDLVSRAARCLDLSQVAPRVLRAVGLESALLLKEVLDRIEVPPFEEIPGTDEVSLKGLSRWRLPHTEISIAKLSEGPRQGMFLFTAETVDNIVDFYERVEHLPYKRGASVKAYRDYIFSPGSMIPYSLIQILPDWLKIEIYQQALWQWIGLMISLLLGGLVLGLIYRWGRRRYGKDQDSGSGWNWGKLLFPISGMLVALVLEYLIVDQINITGSILTISKVGLGTIFLVSAAWAIFAFANILSEGIIMSPRVRTKGIDADFTHLTSRLAALVVVFILFYHAAKYYGLPVTAVFASAGIAGVAVALAARETLANFFGGITIFLDKPFKAGDYIILDSGERGEVKEIGMRSTRILTRDDVLISIPNSVITNVKVINESAPKPRLRVRIKVGVAYGTDVDQVEEILLDLAGNDPLVAEKPKPRVRFRQFGDSSLNFELLAWSRRPHDRGRVVHELNRQIYKAFHSAGIVIPYPQHDVHMYAHPEKDMETVE